MDRSDMLICDSLAVQGNSASQYFPAGIRDEYRVEFRENGADYTVTAVLVA